MIFSRAALGIFQNLLGVCPEPAPHRRREAPTREALGVDEIGDKGLSRGFQKIGEGALLDDVGRRAEG